MSLRFGAAVLLLARFAARAVAQAPTQQALPETAALRGSIVDARTTLPLSGVAVALTSGMDTVGHARSDSAGRFVVSGVATGPVTVHFLRLGYRADSIAAAVGAEAPLRVAMDAVGEGTTLAAVVVRDSAKNDFDRRSRRSGAGVFIRDTDIELRKPGVTSDLLRTIPGVAVDMSRGTVRIISQRVDRPLLKNAPKARDEEEDVALPGRSPEGGTKKCVMRVVVDGQIMPKDYSIDLVRPSDIKGIEIYQGAAGIPIAFSTVQADSPCGLVMLWIKGHAPGNR